MGRRKQTRESSTQTDVSHTIPIVLLNRLSSSPLRRGPDVSESSITIRNPSLMTGPSRPAVSRAPRNYRFFARPITNNERANSTLADESRAPKKRVRFDRPGPLCSKRLPLEEDFRVPVTRSEVPSEVSPPSFHELHLDTVVEHTELSELTGFMQEVVVEESSEKQIGLSQDKKEASLRSYVSATSQPGGSNEEKPTGESSGEQEWPPKGKSVLIRANVVHIYNHFYNGV